MEENYARWEICTIKSMPDPRGIYGTKYNMGY